MEYFEDYYRKFLYKYAGASEQSNENLKDYEDPSIWRDFVEKPLGRAWDSIVDFVSSPTGKVVAPALGALGSFSLPALMYLAKKEIRKEPLGTKLLAGGLGLFGLLMGFDALNDLYREYLLNYSPDAEKYREAQRRKEEEEERRWQERFNQRMEEARQKAQEILRRREEQWKNDIRVRNWAKKAVEDMIIRDLDRKIEKLKKEKLQEGPYPYDIGIEVQ